MENIKELRELIKDVLQNELEGLLNDIRYRIESLYNAGGAFGMVNARDLYMANHQLDGYTVTDNQPSAGSISWTDCNIVYKGTNYAITNGNTSMKYVWWDFSATDKTKFATSDEKPELTDDDVLVFINISGKHHTEINSGKMTHGATLVDGSVNSSEIATGAVKKLNIAGGAVDSTILADGAVTSGKLGNNAVTPGKIASGAVAEGNIAANAVTSGKIKDGAVVDAKIGANAVTSGKIASGAVVSEKIADNAVESDKIALGAVTNAKIGAGAVNSDKLATNAVTSGKIADGAIVETKIGAGEVSASKLNTAMHMIF